MRYNFATHAQTIALAVSREVESSLRSLGALRAFLEHSQEVTEDEFALFTQDLAGSHSDGPPLLEWIPRVARRQRPQFEKELTALGVSRIHQVTDSFDLLPAADRDEYYVCRFVSRLLENSRIIGVDVYSKRTSTPSIESARDTGSMVATGPVKIIQRPQDLPAEVIYVPVYSGGVAPQMVEERRAKVRGMAALVLQPQVLVERALGFLRPGGFQVTLYDVQDPGPPYLLYRHRSKLSRASDPAVVEENCSTLSFCSELRVAGRRWELRATPLPRLVQRPPSWWSWTLLGSGFLVTGLLLAFAFVMRKRLRQVRGLVRRRTEQLRSANRAALAAYRARSQLLANVSHEIRTPLHAVIGMGELMLLTRLNPEQRQYASIIRDSGQSLLSIINDILDFSKGEAGRLKLEERPFSLRAEITSTAAMMRLQAEQKGIGFHVRVSEDIPDRVCGDQSRVRQVMVNLLNNAVKFTEQGRVTMSVALQNDEGIAATVRFSVSDSGIGISEEDQKQLFQPFHQVDGSSTRRFHGTGLGLAISRQLVELMGGTIGVTSELGRGSDFWFVVPLKVEEAATSAAGAVSTLERRDRPGHSKR